MAGRGWKQIADGLDGRDVFVLAQATDGTILAGTNDGIFALAPGAQAWQAKDTIANTLVKTATETLRGTRVNIEKRVKDQLRQMDGRVFALDLSGDAWLASTAGGLFTSRDSGATWQGGPVMGVAGYLSVTAHGALMAAARPDGVVLSQDGGPDLVAAGTSHHAHPHPSRGLLTRRHAVAGSARRRLLYPRPGQDLDVGAPASARDVDDLYYDAQLNKVLVSSRGSDFVYAIDPKTLDWKWWQTGYRISTVARRAGISWRLRSMRACWWNRRQAGPEVGQR